jgi:hypothetical protein
MFLCESNKKKRDEKFGTRFTSYIKLKPELLYIFQLWKKNSQNYTQIYRNHYQVNKSIYYMSWTSNQGL